MESRERLQKVLDYLQISANKFSKSLDLTRADGVYSILKGVYEISENFAMKVVGKYPQISYEWLMYGDGEMLMEKYEGCHLNTFLAYTGLSQTAFANKTKIDVIELYQILDSKKPIYKDIADKIISAFPNVNREWLMNGKGDMIIGEDELQREVKQEQRELLGQYATWMLPTSAIGGSLVGFPADGVKEYECEKVISPIPNIDFAMQVYGDSMEPTYPNGARVFIKRINPTLFIEYNRVYVLNTENGVIIKKVVKSENEGYIKCVSLNEEYPPFEVPMSEIHDWFRVLGCLTINM